MQKKVWRFCGNDVTPEELELILDTVDDCKFLSPTELAHTVCELLDWRRPTGALKAHECRLFLEELAAAGMVNLAGRKDAPRKHKGPSKAYLEVPEVQPDSLTGTLRELGPLDLEVVEGPEAQLQWREWVDRYHYLGCKVPFGASLRYFITLRRPEGQRLGCIQLSSPAWQMASRDRWIGWDAATRVKNLQRIVQNSRFLILPWVNIPHLASASLGLLARRIADDWEARYAVRPVLLETLVDRSRFQGTCYRAANWISLGQTTGRGRMDRDHKQHGKQPKEVLVYPLCRKAQEKLCGDHGGAPVLQGQAQHRVTE